MINNINSASHTFNNIKNFFHINLQCQIAQFTRTEIIQLNPLLSNERTKVTTNSSQIPPLTSREGNRAESKQSFG